MPFLASEDHPIAALGPTRSSPLRGTTGPHPAGRTVRFC